MNLSISVFDRISVIDIFVNLIKKIGRLLSDLFQAVTQTDVEEAIEEVVKVEEATGPPALGIDITDEVRTGDGLV